MKKTIVVFAPHPDDETLGCGGTIARRLREGYDVFVFVLTDGRYSFSVVLGINSDPSPEELKEIRKEETMRSTKILGVPSNNVFFLDLEDDTLSKRENELEKKIVEILQKHTPSEVYCTYKKDYNLDHQATSRVVKRCVQKIKPQPVLYQYSIARPGTCGIYGRVRPVIDAFINLFKKTTIAIDIKPFLTVKEKALREFKSELTILSRKQTRPITLDINHYLKSKEIFFLDN